MNVYYQPWEDSFPFSLYLIVKDLKSRSNRKWKMGSFSLSLFSGLIFGHVNKRKKRNCAQRIWVQRRKENEWKESKELSRDLQISFLFFNNYWWHLKEISQRLAINNKEKLKEIMKWISWLQFFTLHFHLKLIIFCSSISTFSFLFFLLKEKEKEIVRK